MKKHTILPIFILLILSLNFPCSANPLSKIMSFFQNDLVVDVVFKNHRNLISGSEVYLAETLDDEHRTLIGKVKKVSLLESGKSRVEIVIDSQYKDEIFEDTAFVLMSNLFAADSRPFIVAVSALSAPDKTSEKAPLKSGASVDGMTFLEYKIATAGEQFNRIMENIKQQNEALLSQLQEYLDTLNTEAFQKQMDDLINQISKFSIEQKEAFKNEVLPSLKKTFESMMEKLQEQNNPGKSRELEQQFQEIEDLVNV